MSNTRARIRQAIEDTGYQRIRCPECGGGSTGEKCMTIYTADDGGVLATCHRAACDLNTVSVNDRGIDTPKRTSSASTRWRDVYSNSVPISTCAYDLFRLENNIEFKYSSLGLAQIMVLGSDLIFPMYDNESVMSGVVIRKTQPTQGPKSLTFAGEGSTGMCWYRRPPTSVIVVEDCLSAIALFDLGRSAISLNGTHLNNNRLREIMSVFKDVTVALDADATRQAAKLAFTFMSQCNMTVRRLRTDIKNMTREQAEDWLHNCN